MTDIAEARAVYKYVFGGAPPHSKNNSMSWIVHQVNTAQEIHYVLKKVGYPADYDHFNMRKMKQFIQEDTKLSINSEGIRIDQQNSSQYNIGRW